MFHLKPKPSPPWSVGRETPGKAVEFLGDGDRAGEAAVDEFVGPAQEGDRLAVFVAAVGVGQPFAFAPRIVEVEHRGDGVDPQAVDMEPVDPVERVAIEEVRHLVPAEIVDRGVPVRMEALARIGVLVERSAVETRQAVRRRSGNAPAPSRGSRPGPPHARDRRNGRSPPARRSGASARRDRSAGSPRIRRADVR